MIAEGIEAAQASAILDRMGRMTREELLALQFAKLTRQLDRLYHTNAFYRAKLDAAGAQPSRIRSMRDFRKLVPLSTKAEFLADQEEHPPFGRRVGVPHGEIALVNMTGGTSGQGQEVYGRTYADVVVQGYLHGLPWFMAGLRPGHFGMNCVPSGGLTTGGWGPPDGFRIAGAAAIHVGGAMTTDAKIAMMRRFTNVNFIYASTNYVMTLAEGMRRAGVDPRQAFPDLKSIFLVAEGYSLEWAERMKEFWGAALHEGYGSTQAAGFSHVTCRHGVTTPDGRRAMMHALEWHTLIEIIDPETGAPAEPGEEGEIVITNLDIVGAPVLRFSSRDKARYLPHHACSCGRPWDGIETGTIGRYDDMMKIRGNNVWPAAVDAAVFAFSEVEEYSGRVFVDDAGRTGVEVMVALTPEGRSLPDDEAGVLTARIAERIKERTNVRMSIRLMPREDLPNFAYKARRWRDERQEGYSRLARGDGKGE